MNTHCEVLRLEGAAYDIGLLADDRESAIAEMMTLLDRHGIEDATVLCGRLADCCKMGMTQAGLLPVGEADMRVEIVMPDGDRHLLTIAPFSSLNHSWPKPLPALIDPDGDVFDGQALLDLGLLGGHVEAEQPETVAEWMYRWMFTPDHPRSSVEMEGLMELVRPLGTEAEG